MFGHSAFLQYHTDMHERARDYSKERINPTLAKLKLRPLKALGTADAHQLAMGWALPDAQLAYTAPAQMNADYATWHIDNFLVT